MKKSPNQSRKLQNGSGVGGKDETVGRLEKAMRNQDRYFRR